MGPLFNTSPALSRSENGQGAIEAVFLLPVLLLTATLMIQVTLIGMGKIMLQYSAFYAARTGEVSDFNLDEMTASAGRILVSVPGVLSSGPGSYKVAIVDADSSNDKKPDPGRAQAVLPIQIRISWDFPLIVPLAGKILQKNPFIRSATGYPVIKLKASWSLYREAHAPATNRS